MDEMTPEPRLLKVPCFNARDGCRSVVHYMGTKAVRKICRNCLEYNAPLERKYAGAVPKGKIRDLKIPGFWGDNRGPLVEITARPKAAFWANGRVYATGCRT